MSIAERIRELERNQLAEECRLGQDQVAYLPNRVPSSVRDEALQELKKTMLNELGPKLGYIATDLPGFSGLVEQI
jgi:hypothetical protein